ncbi:MAG: hypothetical protein WCK35_01085 [Chloroflexota bacterium]
MFPDWLTNLQVEFGSVPRGLEKTSASGVLWQAAPGRFLLDVPGVARYLAEDGQRLTIEPAPTASESEVARLARTVPLAALLYQRGLLAFHAAAVAVPSKMTAASNLPGGLYEATHNIIGHTDTREDCFIAEEHRIRNDKRSVNSSESTAPGGLYKARGDNPPNQIGLLLAGDSGAGKSSLLASLLQRGWSMLSDDLAAVGLDENNQPVIYPVHSEILLWGDALKNLGLNPFPEIETLENGKRAFSATQQFASQPVPLHTIAWLRVHSEPTIQIESLRGQKFFQAINTLLYNSHIADALLDRRDHFHLASALTQTISIQRLSRPRGAWSVAGLEAKILDLTTQGL